MGMADGVEAGNQNVIWGYQQDFENREEIGWNKERESGVSAGHRDCNVLRHHGDGVRLAVDVLAPTSHPSDQPLTQFV